MTTIKLTGGDLGDDVIMVRCDLTQAAAPVEVQYNPGEGWEPTQYQCADTRHTTGGLAELGVQLASRAYEIPYEDGLECEWEVIDAYEARVRELEAEGMDRSDAQGVADAELIRS